MNKHQKSGTAIICSILIWLFPVLFLVDDIMGFNGYQFTIGGKSIRIILFCLSMLVLCGYSLVVCYTDKISLIPGRKDSIWLFAMLKPVDYLVMLFILGNALWATVVPLMVRGEMQYALKDFSTILTLALYFPVMFLIRTGRLKLAMLEKLAYVLCVLLAIWHSAMYLGELVHPGFYASYYDFIDIISFGTAVRSEVIYGFGIIRVIQTTSLFLLVGVFLSIRYCLQGKYRHILPMLLFIFAICVTYTKSIWFGYLAGLAVYLIPAAIRRNCDMCKRCLIVLVVTVLAMTSYNYLVFDNTIFSRAVNTVRTQEDTERLQAELEAMMQANLSATEPSGKGETSADSTENINDRPVITQEDIEKKQNEIWDARGTQQANQLRAQQNSALLNKWKQSKWLGFGYGSYAQECIRNEQFPYMYESALPALMMKLGLAGCLLWVIFIGGVTVTACIFFWKRERSDVFWWIGMALSYAMAVQTNPFLFTFAGFSVLLYLLIAMQEEVKWSRG